MATAALTPEKVIAWLADNPDGLRLTSAQTALEVLNGPEMTAAFDALQAALSVNQDSAAVPAGQTRSTGDEGSREILARTVAHIRTVRTLAARRVEKLTPAPEEPTPPAD